MKEFSYIFLITSQINNIQANKENSLGRYPFLLAYQMPNTNRASSSSATITPATIPPVLMSPRETQGKRQAHLIWNWNHLMVHFGWWHRAALTDFHFNSSAALSGTRLIHSLAVVLSRVRLRCFGIHLKEKTPLNLPVV